MMADSGNYPPSHATHTTTTTTTRIQPAFRLDKEYPTTKLGILKIVLIILNIICLICTASIYFYPGYGWYYFVCIIGFIVTTTLFFFYLLHVIERLYMVPWLLCELIFSGLWAVFFLIAAGIMCNYAATYSNTKSAGAAAFFGFLAMIGYGIEAYFKFQAWQAGEIAQGTRTSSTTVTSTGKV